ncbi:Pycsar system effector family protein [Streptacidiphilus pinicola]|uniref:Pycsar system effector family protein n=1 Tax=Streptacidiphilus pinicola TaxID=2219663 RepID=UPI001FB4FECE|nr:Pycsar system effector family protein [Streptacidiphilus pinicola]
MSLTNARPDGATGSRYVAERLLQTVRDDLGRADLKASVLLSAATAVPALILSGRAAPAARLNGLPLALLLLGGVFWMSGTFLLLGVIMPRSGTVREADALTFFSDVLSAPDPAALSDRVEVAGRDEVGWLLTQLRDVSAILATKYRWLRWAACLLGLGLAFALYPLATT